MREKKTPEQKKKILHQRAVLLSQEVKREWIRPETMELVEFVINSQRYALPAPFIQEVFPLKNLTPIPGIPPHFLGIINVRGKIMVVIDLGIVLGMKRDEIKPSSPVLILAYQEREMGVVADEVVGICALPLRHIHRRSPPGHAYEEGVAEDDLLILNGKAILVDPKLVVDEGGTG